MEGPNFSGENQMKKEVDIELPSLPVTEATVEKARKLQEEMLARSARKRKEASNTGEFEASKVPVSPAQPIKPSLPYLDRDDDELVIDPADGRHVLKKDLEI
ncbi:MAG: hypothetical protein ACAH17_03810 [Candidatus Paceibacterota bacterium]